MSFESLPADVQREIALNMEPKELITTCSTNKEIRKNICNSETFWRNKLYRDYPLLTKFKGKNETWKTLYLQNVYYISKLEEGTGIPYIKNPDYMPRELFNRYQMLGDDDSLYTFALKKAACGGDEETIKKMLGILDFRVSYIDHAFLHYIACGHRKLYDYFLTISGHWVMALAGAARGGDLELTKKLFDECGDKRRCLLVIMANGARGDHKQIVDFALEKGADSFAIRNGIGSAIRAENKKLAKYLESKL